MLRLTISKGPETVRTLELGPGRHLAGRKDDCAVVLADPAVSSVHAQIEVSAREVVVKDMESLNGLFSQGRKLGKISFTQDVDFEIAGYAFKGRFKPDKKGLGLPAVSLPGLKTLVPGVLFAAVLGTLCAFWITGAWASHLATQRESLRRGALLARCLAEQNVCALRAKLTDQVRLTPVSAEEGVRYVFVADQYGKVLAPTQSIGKILDHPKVTEVLRQGLTTMYDGPEGETILASPIKDAEGLLGVAVVSYSPGSGLAGTSLLGPAFVGAVVAVGLALAGSWLLLRAFFGPIRTMTERIGLALKTGERGLDLGGLDPELADLGQAVDRVLLLPRAQEESDLSRTETQASREPARQDQADQPPAEVDLEGQPGPCFLMDLGDYRILAWNTAFGPLAAPGANPPVHLLRCLADPEHLTAVLGLLETPEAPGEVPLVGSLAKVAKIGAGPGRALFLFTDASHG
jgi:hypothetical protein